MNSQSTFLGEFPPIAIAHRGGGDQLHENTWTAFESASDLGIRVIETDLRLTADGQVITFHDSSLRRTLDVDKKIRDLTYTDLSAYKMGGSSIIPRFEDLLASWPQLKFNVDLKEAVVIRPFVDIIRRTNSYDRICVASFSDRRIARAVSMLEKPVASSTGPLGVARVLLSPWNPKRASHSHCTAIQVPYQLLSGNATAPYLIRRAHERGVHVHAWTVNDRSTMIRLLDAGVDGIVTDATKDLKDLLIDRGQWRSA